MWVKNWYGSYTEWRLQECRVRLWGMHNFIWYRKDVDELLRTTMLEF